MAGQPKAGELNQAFQLPQPPNLLPGALGPSYFCFCLFSLFRGGIYLSRFGGGCISPYLPAG